MSDLIRNDEMVEPGTLVRFYNGGAVYKVLETRVARYNLLEGNLRDMRTGNKVGWRPLHIMERVGPAE